MSVSAIGILRQLREPQVVDAAYSLLLSSRCQHSETAGMHSDDIRPFGLARDNWLVRDGLVGVTGQSADNHPPGDANIEPRPTVVRCSKNLKLKPKIAVGDVDPRTKITRV